MAIKLKPLVQCVVAVAVFVVIGLLGRIAEGVVLCNTDTTKLSLCRPAVTGQHPPPPAKACCAVCRHADLACLCKYKSVLPALGIDPNKAIALPTKCGLTTPPQCKGQDV
ncbi:putative lipid-transfer protein DIR1 isoform X1 [Prosopis cineraria]|uniref:putative lipid-transfer protein DIR1 isoform X1 n=1 Tax=Prosopis cineraria TaxID=364024 RepID=UPI0024106010|nr:putative lipid-transfer protein DIR1 isoform X1 [Prosopis cineraria]